MTNRRSAVGFFLLSIVAWIVPATDARSADKEFQAIVGRLSSQYQRKPMRGMGFLCFIANRFTPSGISGLKMAVFEDLDPNRQPSAAGIDSFVRSVATGADYQPFVRVRSNRHGEQTCIYAREAGKRIEMLIVSVEKDEAVVLKMRLNPETMEKWVDDPVHRGKDSARGSGRASSR